MIKIKKIHSKIIKVLLINAIFYDVNIYSSDCFDGFLKFKENEKILSKTDDLEYDHFFYTKHFLSEIIKQRDMFISNDFEYNNYRSVIRYAFSLRSVINEFKNMNTNKLSKFIEISKINGSKKFKSITTDDELNNFLTFTRNRKKINNYIQNIIFEIQGYKNLRNEINQISEQLSLFTLNDNPQSFKNEKNKLLNLYDTKKKSLNKLLEKEDNDLKSSRNIDFKYDQSNGNTISYKDLTSENINSDSFLKVLNLIDSDIQKTMNINMNKLKDSDMNLRATYLDNDKTISYAHFISNDGQSSEKKYYSISGENYKFNKPSNNDLDSAKLQMRFYEDSENAPSEKLWENIAKDTISEELRVSLGEELSSLLVDSIKKESLEDLAIEMRNDAHSLGKQDLEKRIKLLEKVMDDKIVLVDSSEGNDIPAIDTKLEKPSQEKYNEILNSTKFTEYKNLPSNKDVSEEVLVKEIYLIEKKASDILEKFDNNEKNYDPNARIYDAEHKILKKFLKDTENNISITGTLNIYTSRPACQSCITGYLSFKDQRKNVEVNVVTLTPELTNSLKSNRKMSIPVINEQVEYFDSGLKIHRIGNDLVIKIFDINNKNNFIYNINKDFYLKNNSIDNFSIFKSDSDSIELRKLNNDILNLINGDSIERDSFKIKKLI